MTKTDESNDFWIKFEVPHTYVIIFFLMIFACFASYILPGGHYDRVKKEVKVGPSTMTKNILIAESYKDVDSVPQNPWKMINAVMKGLKDHSAVDIIFFILLVGGAFGIITETKAVEGALSRLVVVLNNREFLVIPAVMIAFSLGGATFGMCEETIPFVAMVVPMAVRLGYDSITGVAMVYIGAMIGFASAFLNPFTVGIAQGIAGIPVFSGFSYRILIWFLFTAISIFWVMNYGRKIKKDPKLSLVYEIDKKRFGSGTTSGGDKSDSKIHSELPFNLGHKLVLIIITLGFAAIIYGAIKLGWYIDEMVAIFLIVGIFSGLVTRLPFNKMAEGFSKGCAGLANAAILVGFARAVLVILQEAKVMDTILHYVSGVVGSLPPVISVQFMYLFQTMTNFFVPSGSGQAALTMPLMAPLADMVGVTRQTAVLAYQFGDGFTNMIIPTSAVTIAVLGMAGVPWGKWARWILPLIVVYYIVGALLLVPPTLIGWNGY